MREREREREREHTSILYNSMWVIIYNRASMWVVNVIQKQTLHKKKRVGRTTLYCHPPFSHFNHAKRSQKETH